MVDMCLGIAIQPYQRLNPRDIHYITGEHAVKCSDGTILQCDHGDWALMQGCSVTCQAQWDELERIVRTKVIDKIGDCILEGRIGVEELIVNSDTHSSLGYGLTHTNAVESIPALISR